MASSECLKEEDLRLNFEETLTLLLLLAPPPDDEPRRRLLLLVVIRGEESETSSMDVISLEELVSLLCSDGERR